MMTPPRAVRDLVDRLRVACRAEPSVVWDEKLRHWRIILANKRIVMTLDHKITPGARWVWASSTLTVDGVRGPIADSFEHFVRVWKSPKDLANPKPVPPPFATPITVVVLDEMPTHIAYAVKQVVGKEGLTDPVVGYVDDHFWAIEFSFPRASLRVHWDRGRNDPMPSDHLFLIIDGVDRSDEAKGKMEKALAVIGQIPHPGVAGPASVDSASGSQRDRGVEVRSTHVIRT